MIREAIEALVEGNNLTQEQAAAVMEEIMEGQATPAQLGAFLTALRLKGETVAEIAGLAAVMRAKATKVPFSGPCIDTCGTGGDNSGSFNISTAAAFVAAGAGLTVAKHGNRAATSHCGSADVLEALGVKIALSPEGVAACLEQVGIGFMFAPSFHPAMRHAAGPRREIGIRTVFNILGPLTNPAGAQAQVIGVAHPTLAPKMAEALKLLGSQRALVVHSQDGMDEISLAAPTAIYDLKDGIITDYAITPEDVGFATANPNSLRGGSAEENAATLRSVLGGKAGPLRDVVLMNAAAALVAGGKASSIKAAIPQAAASIDSGRALKKLEGLVQVSQRCE